jgi:hypothetical protein
MTLLRHLAIAIVLVLLSLPAAPAERLVPSSGAAFAPLPTDEPVRLGMLAIRDLVRINHSLVTHRRMPPDHAQRFAKQVKAESEKILSTTKLSGDGREKLRGLLDEVVAGIDAVAKPAAGADPLDGLVRADEALARYGKEFDHPDWPPLQALD